MIMLKRKRDPTFTASEKMTLINMVENHFSVVESKKTDTLSIKKKHEAWQKIADEFNTISNIYSRDWAVLKNCWENLKKRAKQQKNLSTTEQGQTKKRVDDPATDRVMNLICSRVSGYINPFDSDSAHILATGSDTCDQYHESIEEYGSYNRSGMYALKSLALLKTRLDVQTVETCQMPFHCYDRSADLILAQNLCENEPQVQLREGEAVDSSLTVEVTQFTPGFKTTSTPARSRSPSPEAQQSRSQSPSTSPRAEVVYDETANATSLNHKHKNRCRRPYKRRDRPTPIRSFPNRDRLNNIIKERYVNAKEEHDIQINILRLQEQKEIEILEQEKLKTRQEQIKLALLELELRRLKE